MPTAFDCAVCSSIVSPEDFGLCGVCGWEGDPVQEDDPNYRGGANPDSLNERKAWWARQNSSPRKVAQAAYAAAAVL